MTWPGRIFSATVAAACLFLLAHPPAWGANVGDGGNGLPACSAGLFGAHVYGLYGHDWLCVAGPYHWVITR